MSEPGVSHVGHDVRNMDHGATGTGGGLHVELSDKRVRGVLAGEVVADSTRPLLVWERPHHPAYYFPSEDVRTDLISDTSRTEQREGLGQAHLHTLRVGERAIHEGVITYPDSPIERIRGHIRFRWKAVDSWFEEDEEIYVHPRDPYTRIDILASSRQVLVEIGGVTVADSYQPRLLFETNVPTRYYLPKIDTRLDLLEPSETITRCPYKGTAAYYSARIDGTVYPDIAWFYRTPFPESQKIAGMLAFYSENVNLFVDGVPMRTAPVP